MDPDSQARENGTSPVAVTRSEERLRVQVPTVPYERVVVRKVVVTEPVTVTVQVRREELRIERFAVPDPQGSMDVPTGTTPHRELVDGATLELVLRTETPVVTLQVVPIERVSVTTRVVSQLETMAVGLRSERVQLSEDRTAAPSNEGETG